MGGVYSLSFGKNNVGIISNNHYFQNFGDIAAVFDIDFLSGLILFLQETFIENVGYQFSKNKAGSASMGSLRTSKKAFFFMINTLSILNWCEAKGKEKIGFNQINIFNQEAL